MYDDDQMLMLSGIQHFMFCKRQWALIHINQQWADNWLTAEGYIMHANVTSPDGQTSSRKVAKECQNYGQRVQNSVFECVLDEARYIRLKNTLCKLINKEADSLRFYQLGHNWKNNVVHFGCKQSIAVTDTLIIYNANI